MVRQGRFPRLAAQLGDLRWHDNLHAMRTEWAHFSTIFIGEDNGVPVICGAAPRAPSDKRVLRSDFQFRLDELRGLANACLLSLEAFATYLIPLAVAKLDLGAEITAPAFDAGGALRLAADHRLVITRTTVRTHLGEMGLACRQELIDSANDLRRVAYDEPNEIV